MKGSSSRRWFVVCLVLALSAPAIAQKGKQKLTLHPSVEAYFVLPADLQPSAQQQQQLAQLRQVYGPRLQAMAPAVMQALNIREVKRQAKPILGRVRKARRAGVHVPRLGAGGSRRKLKAATPQVRAVLRRFEALEKEIDQQIARLLTPQQKKSLAERKKAGKKNRPKNKKKAGKN